MPVLCSVSGGKDSQAVTIALMRHLRAQDLSNRVVLYHADLGSIEWAQSIVKCRELAEHFGLEIAVTGEGEDWMMTRWHRRWELAKGRYARLEIAKLIQPWSTPANRFCTSESKIAPSKRMARRLFGKQPYISVTGVRRAESRQRSKSSVSQWADAGRILEWRAIADYSTEMVFDLIADEGLAPHHGYTVFGLDRISCVGCVMQSFKDMLAASNVPEHAPVFRRLIDLEQNSGYSFQSGRWVMDVAEHLLTEQQRARVAGTRVLAAARAAIETTIPPALLFTDGWPTEVPSLSQAQALADARRRICDLYGIDSPYLSASTVQARIEELFLKGREKAAAKNAREVKAAARVAKQSTTVIKLRDLPPAQAALWA